jgi:hypothetical protein
MPTGAILYVQVPNSTTCEDWECWRDLFIENFDLGLNHSPEWYADLLAPDWRFLDRPVVANDSIWNVFPESVFLEVNLGDTYYSPGYERGVCAGCLRYSDGL